MAEDTIEVDAEADVLTVRCRNLITKPLRNNQDVLEFDALIFNLDVPLPLAHKTLAKLSPDTKRMLAKVATKTEYIVEQARKTVEEEVKKLIDLVEDLQKKDGRGDQGAYKQAGDAIKKAVARIEDVLDGVPPTIRKAVENEIRGDANYKKDKLFSSGTWSFRTNKGMWIKSGKFKNITKDDDDAGAELKKGIDGAKSASASNPFDFILASGREAGLVIRKRVAGADKKTALERREGSGQVYYGEILYEKSKYVFVLDKDCSVGQGAKLAKQIQEALKQATGKRYPIRVEAEGYGEEEEGDA
jgi:hypothetical protein